MVDVWSDAATLSHHNQISFWIEIGQQVLCARSTSSVLRQSLPTFINTRKNNYSLLSHPIISAQQAGSCLLSLCHTGIFDFFLFQFIFFYIQIKLIFFCVFYTVQCWRRRSSDMAMAELFSNWFSKFSKSQKKKNLKKKSQKKKKNLSKCVL